MSEHPRFVSRVLAKVRALLPKQWRSEAGRKLRDAVGGISEYSQKDIRIRERLQEAPDVLWNTAKVKSSEALLKAAEEENKRIASELARQTLADKARQEKATADRMETEARISKIKEMEERIAFVEKLRAANAVPVWDRHGNMKVVKAPPDYDWDGLTSALLEAADLSLPAENEAGEATSSARVSRKLGEPTIIEPIEGLEVVAEDEDNPGTPRAADAQS